MAYNKYQYRKPVVYKRSMYGMVDNLVISSAITQLERNNKGSMFKAVLTETTIIIEEV